MEIVDEELKGRFRAYVNDSAHLESVIITLQPNVDLGDLERAGMIIERTMSNHPIVAGKIDSSTLQALSSLDGVLRIELDSTMRALGA